MLIKDICKEANIDMDELNTRTIEYFEAKISRPQYQAYIGNDKACAQLLIDCQRETLLSMLSMEGKLNLVFNK